MRTRAVIFDMDGVIIRSQQAWRVRERAYLKKILAPDLAVLAQQEADQGLALSLVYENLQKRGYTGNSQEFLAGYNRMAPSVYQNAPLTPDIDLLLESLHGAEAAIALISASSRDWMDYVLKRLSNADLFTYIESVHNHPTLRPKPAPDGYLAAMKKLGIPASETLIVEDSQAGIRAAISSGAHVCGFLLHTNGAIYEGCDWYAATPESLREVCMRFAKGKPLPAGHVTDLPAR